MTWHGIGDTRGVGLPDNFGNLLDNRHLLTTGDFNKDGRTDIMMHYATDGNWFLGQLTNNYQLQWHSAGNTRGVGTTINFGDLFNDRHAITTGDFISSDLATILFHSATDVNWWLGLLNRQSNQQLEWYGVGNTRGVGSSVDLGDMLDKNGRRTIIVGNFDRDHRDDIAVYNMNTGQWMFGTLGRNVNWMLDWHPVGTSSFGHLANGQHWITNDFNFNQPYGRSDIVFHHSVDGHWFLGVFDSANNDALGWKKIGDTRGSDATNDYGNLLDGNHELWSGDFDGNAQKILFHHDRDGNWFLGTLDRTNNILKWDFLPQFEVVARR